MGGRLTLKRIVVDLRAEEMVLRVLYTDQDGPNPGTKARARAVAKLARAGLRDALQALDAGDVAICGTSGYTTREDLLVVDTKDATIAEEGSAA
jgi:hypothetical protein